MHASIRLTLHQMHNQLMDNFGACPDGPECPFCIADRQAGEIAKITGELAHAPGCRYGEFTRAINADGHAETYPCTCASIEHLAPEPATFCPECGITSSGLCESCQELRNESHRLNHQYPFRSKP